MKSTLAACLANTSGLCAASSETPVPSLIVEVLAAMADRHTSGSTITMSGGTAREPSGV